MHTAILIYILPFGGAGVGVVHGSVGGVAHSSGGWRALRKQFCFVGRCTADMRWKELG